MADIIDHLAGLANTDPVSKLRRRRSQARDNAQRSFAALFEPDHLGIAGAFDAAERYAIAAFVAGLHRDSGTSEAGSGQKETAASRAERFYLDLLADEVDTNGAGESLAVHDALPGAIAELATFARADVASVGLAGPYGIYREEGTRDESLAGPDLKLGDEQKRLFGPRLSSAREFAHLLVLHPRDSRPQRLAPLAHAGWTATEVVSLGQLVAFLSFQLRDAHGLDVLAHGSDMPPHVDEVQAAAPSQQVSVGPRRDAVVQPNVAEGPGLAGGAFGVLSYPELVRPTGFVTHSLGWKPWIPPLSENQLTDRQREALIDPLRAKSPYFRLLARDPDALEARTLTDKDIFYSTADGLPRAERELAAAVTSRLNGCVYCASVHTGRALQESAGRPDAQRAAAAIDRLCARGVGAHGADLGSELWNVLGQAAADLSYTPPRFNHHNVEDLQRVGLDAGEIIDVINASAFFNWANRLMLSFGEPEIPRRFLLSDEN